MAKSNIPTVSIKSIEFNFTTAVKASIKASTTLSEAFDKARIALIGDSKTLGSKKRLRNTLVAWSTSAGIEEKTAKNIISKLMKAAGLQIRNRAEQEVTPEERKALADLQKFCAGHKTIASATTRILGMALDAARAEASE